MKTRQLRTLEACDQMLRSLVGNISWVMGTPGADGRAGGMKDSHGEFMTNFFPVAPSGMEMGWRNGRGKRGRDRSWKEREGRKKKTNDVCRGERKERKSGKKRFGRMIRKKDEKTTKKRKFINRTEE